MQEVRVCFAKMWLSKNSHYRWIDQDGSAIEIVSKEYGDLVALQILFVTV